jgi:hypothetical protein
MYVFGIHQDGRVDVVFSGEDLCTVKAREAALLIGLFNERGAALQWLLDHSDEELRKRFSEYIDTLPLHSRLSK